jgi:hypothetical protein
MANSIVKNIPEEALKHSIEKIEISKIGKGPDDKSGFFLNIFLKDEFVHQRIHQITKSKEIKL